jgi:hypothetical protein
MRRTKSLGEFVPEIERFLHNTVMAERTLKEYATPSTDEPQNQFSGSPIEDPNLHIYVFLRISGTLKENQEAVRLHLFPFSLRDRASAWFHSLEVGSITSWDQMRQAFLA